MITNRGRWLTGSLSLLAKLNIAVRFGLLHLHRTAPHTQTRFVLRQSITGCRLCLVGGDALIGRANRVESERATDGNGRTDECRRLRAVRGAAEGLLARMVPRADTGDCLPY